jgi:chromosome segregation ATPase
MSVNLKKLYEGTERLEDGRYRIIEKMEMTPNRVKKLPLQESILIEGSETPCRGAYTFKIWELDQKNLNERVYSTPLAKRVIEQDKVTLGLSNHPEDDGDVRDIFAVEKNPRVEEGWMVTDFFLVGDKGGHVKEILEAGGSIGVSSSALGELNESTGEVMVESFELERYGDHVMNPSNGYENQLVKTTQMGESVQNEENKPSEIDLTISNELTEKTERYNVMSTKEQKLHEKVLTTNIKALLKEAKNISDEYNRLNSLEEIMTYFDEDFANDGLRESVEVSIKETKTEIAELTAKGREAETLAKKVEESEEATKTLEEAMAEKEKELAVLKEAMTETKKRYQRVKGLVEKSNDSKELTEKVEIMEREKDEAVQGVVDNQSKLEEAEKGLKVIEAERDSLVEAVKTLEGERDSLTEAVKKSSKRTTAIKERKTKRPISSRDRKITEKVAQKYGGKEFTESDKVVDYYEYSVKKNPKLAEIKEKVLESKTVSDAQIRILRFENQEDIKEDLRRREKEMKFLDEFGDLPLQESKTLSLKDGLW